MRGVEASIPWLTKFICTKWIFTREEHGSGRVLRDGTRWSTFFVDVDRTCYRGSSSHGPHQGLQRHRWTVDDGDSKRGVCGYVRVLDVPGALSFGASGGSKRHKQGSCRIGQRKRPFVLPVCPGEPSCKTSGMQGKQLKASGLARPSRSPGPSFDERRFGSGCVVGATFTRCLDLPCSGNRAGQELNCWQRHRVSLLTCTLTCSSV